MLTRVVTDKFQKSSKMVVCVWLKNTPPYENLHTQQFYGSVDFVRDNPGEPVPVTRRNIRPLTLIVVINQPHLLPYENLNIFKSA